MRVTEYHLVSRTMGWAYDIDIRHRKTLKVINTLHDGGSEYRVALFSKSK